MSDIKLKNLKILYRQKGTIITAIDDVSFTFHNEKNNVLIGYSGCGKTSLLNAVAGKILFNGEIYIGDKNIEDISIEDRRLAYVSQDFVLYPHMTIYDNIAFPLKLQKLPREEIDIRVRSVADRLDISFLLTRRPKYLSIGQQQRAAIARALVKKPDILLMDEPLSNVDKETGEEIKKLIKEIMKENKITLIYVSHDITSALSLADYIFVLNEGKLIGEYTPGQFLRENNEIVMSLKQDLPHEK
ncbi:MAG: ABC transporter ATP-binding protein [Bacilli bacterium]|nr:ABC transporter ATP-binding protein [Bacilli bacterium]